MTKENRVERVGSRTFPIRIHIAECTYGLSEEAAADLLADLTKALAAKPKPRKKPEP